MDGHPPTVLSVIALMVLAGCAGIPFIDSASDNEDIKTPSTKEKIEYPAGYAKSGIVNPEQAVAHHFSALHSLDSFTLKTKTPFLYPETNVTTVSRINNAEKHGFVTINTSFLDGTDHHREEHQSGKRFYAMYDSTNNITGYDGDKQLFEEFVSTKTNEEYINQSVVADLLTHAKFSEGTQIRRDGKTLIRYNSTELVNETEVLPLEVRNSTVNEFDATLLVDKQGIVRSAAYSMTYTTSDGYQITTDISAQVSHINATSVDKPEWVEEAETQTNATSTTTSDLSNNSSVGRNTTTYDSLDTAQQHVPFGIQTLESLPNGYILDFVDVNQIENPSRSGQNTTVELLYTNNTSPIRFRMTPNPNVTRHVTQAFSDTDKDRNLTINEYPAKFIETEIGFSMLVFVGPDEEFGYALGGPLLGQETYVRIAESIGNTT